MQKTGFLSVILKGGLLGIANIIPGVSGGTMALVLGIYERIIKSLNSIDIELARTILATCLFKKGAFEKLKKELKRIDFWFMSILGTGAIASIFATSKLIVWLLNEQHDPTYGFFLGLILVSIIVPCKMFKSFGIKEFIMILVATLLTVGITKSMSGEETLANAKKKYELKLSKQMKTPIGSEEVSSQTGHSASSLTWIFVCAAIAISAMILPGISGSFIMILLGVYFDVLEAVSNFDIVVLMVFTAGMAVGILLFARLLNYVFDHFYNLTIAFLVGLMFGSLYGLWPFKSFEMVGTKRVDLEHIIPSMDGNFALTIASFLLGAVLVGIMLRFESPKEEK